MTLAQWIGLVIAWIVIFAITRPFKPRNPKKFMEDTDKKSKEIFKDFYEGKEDKKDGTKKVSKK